MAIPRSLSLPDLKHLSEYRRSPVQQSKLSVVTDEIAQAALDSEGAAAAAAEDMEVFDSPREISPGEVSHATTPPMDIPVSPPGPVSSTRPRAYTETSVFHQVMQPV